MKSYCLLFILLAVNFHHASAEIRNGYEKEVDAVRRSLRGLTELLQNTNDLSAAEKQKMKERISSMITYITFYEITNKLLSEFRLIAPELYNEIDHIKDNRGNPTDVYVKFIYKTEARVQAAGVTGLAQSEHDTHTYVSEYGEGTVSVKIWIIDKAVWVLAHEFGHIKYQVPHLNRYIEYYKHNYRTGTFDPNHVGHNPDDPSGREAMAFENEFRKLFARMVRNNYKPVSPMLLMNKIRKQVMAQTVAEDQLAFRL